MRISLSESGKRFNRDWIFRKFSYEFETGRAYAIVGPNGSGKSTLLQVAGGAIAASTGEIKYTVANNSVEPDDVYQYISIAAPYLELIEEMSVLEFLEFHAKFKPLMRSISIEEIIRLVGLEKAIHKQIRYYSSGMKQRVKLAQAIFSDTPCLLLDEPCTNLDAEGISLYKNLINNYTEGRLVIVSSNDEQEFFFCEEKVSILDFK